MKIDVMTLKRIIKEELGSLREPSSENKEKPASVMSQKADKLTDLPAFEQLIKQLGSKSQSEKIEIAKLFLQKLGLSDLSLLAKTAASIRKDKSNKPKQ